MRVAIVTNQAPFIRGGAELLTDALVAELRARGVEAAAIRIPFAWEPPQRVLEHALAARLMRIGNVDRLIAMKFPAYFVQHDNKIVWLLHQFRQAYDLWGTELGGIPDTPEGHALRDAVASADNRFLPEARRIFTNNSVVSERLRMYNGIKSEVLYPPLLDAADFRCEGYGDFLFYPSRIGRAKRQELAVEAMAHTTSGVRLVIAGPPDAPDDLRRLEALVAELGVGDRVEVRGGWIPHEEKVALYANARGVVYIPYDEDSYGYVTLEAYRSCKPVVTCTDSGGTRDVVVNGETGLAVPPDAVALGAAIDAIGGDAARARALGEAGREHVDALDITWDHVVESLLA